MKLCKSYSATNPAIEEMADGMENSLRMCVFTGIGLVVLALATVAFFS